MANMVTGKKPTSAELELFLLEETTEDWKGLWEISGALRSDLSLSGSDAELGAVVTPVMLTLLHRGLIEFRRNQWAKKEFVPVPKDQVEALLADSIHWSVGTDKAYYDVWCTATEEGKHAFHQLLKRAPQT